MAGARLLRTFKEQIEARLSIEPEFVVSSRPRQPCPPASPTTGLAPQEGEDDEAVTRDGSPPPAPTEE